MSTHHSSSNPSRPAEGSERPLDPSEKDALFEALALGLEDALPGISVLDRALVLDDGVGCDLAAVDAAGRLVVVILAEPDPDRATLAVVDLVTWVRAHAAVLVRHLNAPALRPEQPPRTLVVLTETAEVLRQRLATLGSAGVELFGLRTIQSAAGDKVYLSSISSPDTAANPPSDPSEAFIGALPEDLRELGRHAVERIARLDDELVALPGRDSILWRFRGESLVRLERNGDRLRATLGPEHEVRPLRHPEDVEDLLEGALSRLVPLFSRPRIETHSGPSTLAGGSAAGGGTGSMGDPSSLAAPRAMARGYPSHGEPLLTAEELEAFRD